MLGLDFRAGNTQEWMIRNESGTTQIPETISLRISYNKTPGVVAPGALCFVCYWSYFFSCPCGAPLGLGVALAARAASTFLVTMSLPHITTK